MSEEKKATILIVEDDLDIADMLNAYFRVQGYDVLTVNWGEDGVNACQTNLPDLVILDIRLPDIDGFEVARRLRTNRRTRDIPIIFLTEKRERMDRLKGLELHAEDYITKPFDIQELRLRVRNALLRYRRGSLTNPVTGMPEGAPVDEQIQQWAKNPNSGMLVLGLRNLEQFREAYGFVASDDLLRAVALMIENTIHEPDIPDAFLGHVSTSELVIITLANALPILKERIHKRLEQSFDYFYSDQDRETNRFENERLSVMMQEFLPAHSKIQDLQQLKTELEQVIR